MDVIYFLVCVRRYESNLPTNICMTVGRKHNNTEKNAAFLSETTFLPFLKFYDSMVCFLLPKCVCFYQWCLSGLSSQHYVSMIFVKQCW